MAIDKTLSAVTEAEYRKIHDYLSTKTGLNLRRERKEELLTVLQARLVAEFSSGGFEEYFSHLEAEGEGGYEHRHLVSRLTVGETHFFRNRPQFEALKHHIFPEIIKKKRDKDRQLRIWSAGCSTGEEPYSLAMLLMETVPDIAVWSIFILATDINEMALKAAREGMYRAWSFRDVDEFHRRRYFQPQDKGWRINRDLVDMVTFRYLNLAEDTYPSTVNQTEDLDLIICRNVMIYFNLDLCRQITHRFYRCLRDDGHLLVGHSEYHEMIYPKFRRNMFDSAICYQKDTGGPYWEKGIKPRFRGSGRPTGNPLVPTGSGFKRKGKKRPDDTKETVAFEKAVSHYRTLQMEEARECFQDVLRLNPRNDRAIYMIAMVQANAGDMEAAQVQALKVLDLNPLHLEAIYLLAMICRIRGESEEELSWLKKAVYIDQFFVLGHFQMAVYYLRSGNEKMARRSLLNVLGILKDRDDSDSVQGVDGLTVGRLRKTAFEMVPGPVPQELALD